MTACRSCGAAVVWATMESTGKAHPFDEAPTRDGKFAIVAGKAHSHGPADARLLRDRFTSHFATCPDAKDWRSR